MPDLPKGKRGYYSDPFQKWFSRFLAHIGAKTPKTSFYSFRHCYRDAVREADISPERVRALGGWTSKGGAEEIYGAGHRASTLAKEGPLSRLGFEPSLLLTLASQTFARAVAGQIASVSAPDIVVLSLPAREVT